VARERIGSISQFINRISIVGGVHHHVMPVTNFIPVIIRLIVLSNANFNGINGFDLERVDMLMIGVVSARFVRTS
jgi:hypothetical protein